MSSPWIESGSPQRTTSKPGIADLYKSPNVYINGVPVVLYAQAAETGNPGSSAVNGNVVFSNSPAGIKAALDDMNRFDPNLATEEDVGAGSGDPPPPAVPPNGCSRSKHFNLSHAKHEIVAQRGLSKEQIQCNWINLCANVLDRLKDAGWSFNINSGFRSMAFNNSLGNASKTSDHLIGCAADISMGSVAQNKALFKYIVKNIDAFKCSQVIYENNWVHVAYNGKSKGDSRTAWTYTGKAPYGSGGSRGQNLPSDLKP